MENITMAIFPSQYKELSSGFRCIYFMAFNNVLFTPQPAEQSDCVE